MVVIAVRDNQRIEPANALGKKLWNDHALSGVRPTVTWPGVIHKALVSGLNNNGRPLANIKKSCLKSAVLKTQVAGQKNCKNAQQCQLSQARGRVGEGNED